MRVRYLIQAALLLTVFGGMLFSGGGEWYARTVYPVLYSGLSFFSSFFPFSVGDVFIYGSILGLLIYLLVSLIRRKGIGRVLRREAEYLVWVYIWFYLAWGLNYYRDDFYVRARLERQSYSEETFRQFLSAYTDSLNRSYCLVGDVPLGQLDAEVKRVYRELAPTYELARPADHLTVKPMLFSRLMSAVGVSGYIGPFFIEYNLNRDLLPIQYPATYAHEMAHVLGIANEAEANFYSYQVCTRSSVAAVRFSGYFSLLPYVLSNARRALPKEEYRAWAASLRPEILALYRERAEHWAALYNPLIGDLQDKLYNFYLKGNRISSGTANYSEVIALVIAASSAK